jgi:hypothetical protein
MRTKPRTALLALLAGLTILGGGRLSADPPSDAERQAAEFRAAREKVAQLEAKLKASATLNEQLREDTEALLKLTRARSEETKKQLAVLEEDLKAAAAQAKELAAQNAALEKDLLTEKKKSAEFEAFIKATRAEAAQSLADKNALKKQLNAAEAAALNLREAANKARDKQVAAEIARIALQEVNRQLEERTQDLVKENARLTKQLQTGHTGAGVTLTAVSAPNPPNFKVDGKVLNVTPDGLVEISVGSDAGLKKDHTLEVFRTTPRPQYLCMIRIVTVDTNRSVGQIVGKPVKLERGDNVTSKITDK